MARSLRSIRLFLSILEEDSEFFHQSLFVDGLLDGIPSLKLLRELVEVGVFGTADRGDEFWTSTRWPDADVCVSENEETSHKRGQKDIRNSVLVAQDLFRDRLGPSLQAFDQSVEVLCMSTAALKLTPVRGHEVFVLELDQRSSGADDEVFVVDLREETGHEVDDQSRFGKQERSDGWFGDV